MNLEELRSVQRAERQKDSLQHLRDEFYEDVAAYIAQLKDERERAVAAADDPFASEDVRRLTDTIESTKEVVNALYERRVGKVVKHASFAAADMATDQEGMTAEERELFDDLVARIRKNRQTVRSTLEGTGDGTVDEAEPASSEASPAVDDAPTNESTRSTDRSGVEQESANSPVAAESTTGDDLLSDALGEDSAADAGPASASTRPPGVETDASTGGDDTAQTEPTSQSGSDAGRPAGEATAMSDGPVDAPPPAPADAATADTAPTVESESDSTVTTGTASSDTAPDTERTTLRITADVGSFYGVDEREYDLVREDVVTLPTTNAEPLLQKNAAERID